MALSPEKLRELQQKSWGQQTQEPEKIKTPAVKKPSGNFNKYLNMAKNDIINLIELITKRKERSRKRGEYRDFMEHHFGKVS